MTSPTSRFTLRKNPERFTVKQPQQRFQVVGQEKPRFEVKKEETLSDPKGALYNTLVSFMPEELARRTDRGVRSSATAILAGQGLTLDEIEQAEREDPNFLYDIYEGLVTLGSDIPVGGSAAVAATGPGATAGATLGGAIGSTAGPAGTAAGLLVGSPIGAAAASGAAFFGSTAFIKETYREYLEHKRQGGALTFEEFKERSENVLTQVGKESLIGGATGSLGQVVKPFAKPGLRAFMAETAGEITGLEGSKALLEGKLPTSRELVTDVATIGVLKAFRSRKAIKEGRKKGAALLDVSEEALAEATAKRKPTSKLNPSDMQKVIKNTPSQNNMELGKRITQEESRIKRLGREVAELKAKENKTSLEARELSTKEGLRRTAVRKLDILKEEQSATKRLLSPEKEPRGFSEKAKEEYKVNKSSQPRPSESDTKLLENVVIDGVFANGVTNTGAAPAVHRFVDKFNISRPFERIGAKETGFAVKNYYSQISAWEDRGLAIAKRLGKEFTPAERSLLPLLAERPKPPKDPHLAKGYHMMRDFFEESFAKLKEVGVLEKPFPQSRIDALRNENQVLLHRLKAANKNLKPGQAKTKKIKMLQSEISDNVSVIKQLQDIKFIHLPTAIWMEKGLTVDPSRARRGLRLANQHKRKANSLQQLIDQRIISPSDVDAIDIMGYYSRRVGKDVGLASILKAGFKEGLLSKKHVNGYDLLPKHQYPFKTSVYAHPQFADFLHSFTNPIPRNAFDKYVAAPLKSMSFYNPAVMPMNDVFQFALAVTADPKSLAKLPTYAKRGITDYVKKTPEYYRAQENGLFSTPFNLPFDDFARQLDASKTKGSHSLKNVLVKALPHNAFKSFYAGVHNAAWLLDRNIRMMSYHYFLDKGMTPREAAQTAALFHGDYARVHPNTRRRLNQFFYTPTFKIVMGQLYADMLKNSAKYGKAALTGRAVGVPVKAMAKGLLGTAIINYGIDSYMNSQGFETDQFARKYSKRVEDDEGVDKDLTISFSNPANLPLKFYFRGVESFAPGQAQPLLSFVQKNFLESSRVIQIVTRAIQNEKVNGDPIVDVFGDSDTTKIAKTTKWLLQEALPVFTEFEKGEGFGDEEAQAKVSQELGKIATFLPFLFGYLTDPKEVKQARKAQAVINKLISEEKRRARDEKEPLSEEQLQNYLREAQKVLEN